MSEYIEKEALRQFPIRKDHYDKENGDEHFIFGIEAVLEYAENLPAADVAPVVHGRWEQIKEWATKAKYRCSVCGREIMSAVKVNIEKYPYCHCGAKMDLEG
ncbi:hypothetical protein [Intestinimonas timonensis]|jgi:hypothetical protein|uniref:hypothetical protein n=1 Tax=Intestinimonas timonensis TaxID=1689270 RepID=UPI0010300FD5|nr:hypothetical protein [Intestinimonas timonensis]